MRSGRLTIATFQHPVGADIRTNLAAVMKQVRSAKSQQADIAHFSECNLTGYAGLDFKEINRKNIPVINDALEQLKDLARAPGIDSTWFIPDSLLSDSALAEREARRSGRRTS